MQPYQEATEEVRRQGEIPLKAAQTAGSIGATAATAYLSGGVINRVLPFLSKYIPEDLVKKGLSKIDPRYGRFIDKALGEGKTIEEVKEFIGQKIQGEQKSKPAKEKRNIIEQYSPELHQFLEQEIKKGRKPIEAGALAQNDKRFSSAISKMSKDHKTNWSSIIDSVYGIGETAQPQQEIQEQQPQQNIQQPSQQSGQGQQALMAIMQKINQRLGG